MPGDAFVAVLGPRRTLLRLVCFNFEPLYPPFGSGREGLSSHYLPDFLVQAEPGLTLILEIKGQEDDQDKAKHEAAQRWVRAVNRWGEMGRWGFLMCHNPQGLFQDLQAWIATQMRSASVS